MEPLTLAICDDLPEERDKLISMLELCPFPTRITQFESGEELLKSFQPDSFDLLLMDIYLDGINGVETVRSIRAVDAEIPIAFQRFYSYLFGIGYMVSIFIAFINQVNGLFALVLAEQVYILILITSGNQFFQSKKLKVVGEISKEITHTRIVTVA